MTGAGGRVMVVTAHPDDPEFLAGGTVACHLSQVGDLKDVEARMRAHAAAFGKEKGHMYAEGFDNLLLPG